MDGKIALNPMITHVLKLEEINRGFELMHAGESTRSVVSADGADQPAISLRVASATSA